MGWFPRWSWLLAIWSCTHTHTEIAVNSPHKMNIFQSSRSPMPAQYQRFIHGCCKRHVGMYVCNSWSTATQRYVFCILFCCEHVRLSFFFLELLQPKVQVFAFQAELIPWMSRISTAWSYTYVWKIFVNWDDYCQYMEKQKMFQTVNQIMMLRTGLR